MAENPTVVQVRALCQEAKSRYSGIESDISAMENRQRTVEQAIGNLENKIKMKDMAIQGRETQIHEAQRRIQQYQAEYASLIDQAAFADSEEEKQAVQARVQQLRQMAMQEQSRIEKMQREVQQLSSERENLKAERLNQKKNLEALKGKLSEVRKNCARVGKTLCTGGNILAMIASQMNHQATAFERGQTVKFHSAFAGAAQWRSQEAQKVNAEGAEAIAVGQRYKKLASNSSNDHDRDERER